MTEVIPTPRVVLGIVQRPKSYLLRLECGHDRSIGGSNFEYLDKLVSKDPHASPIYRCFDGHCGRPA